MIKKLFFCVVFSTIPSIAFSQQNNSQSQMQVSLRIVAECIIDKNVIIKNNTMKCNNKNIPYKIKKFTTTNENSSSKLSHNIKEDVLLVEF